MSVASKLPSIITKKIFRYAYKFDEDLKSFVQGLQLSAVCKQWREDALPLICSCAFIMFRPAGNFDFGEEDEAQLLSLLESNSNIMLIRNSDFYHMTKEIKLYTKDFDSLPNVYLNALSKLLGFRDICWGNVSTLDLDFNKLMFSEKISEYTQAIESFGYGLFKSMPSLANMKLCSKMTTDAHPLVKAIVDKYMHEQKLCVNSDSKKLSGPELPDSIRQFQLDLDKAPSDNKDSSHSYKFSRLYFTCDTNSPEWVDFISKCSPNQNQGVIEYPYLKQLEIYFFTGLLRGNDDNNYIGRQQILSLPELEKLTVNILSPKACISFLSNDQYCWPNLKYLELKISSRQSRVNNGNDSDNEYQDLQKIIQDKMPNLEYVTIQNANAIKDIEFYKRMLHGFGDRVVSYTDLSKESFQLPVFSSCLTYLKLISGSMDLLGLVAANTNTLRELWLENVGYDFDWTQLQTNDSGVIKFPVLKCLHIIYKDNVDIDILKELMSISAAGKSKPGMVIEFSMLSELFIADQSALGIWRVMVQHTLKANNALTLQLHENTKPELCGSDKYNEMLDNIAHAIIKAMPGVKHLQLQDLSPYNNKMFDILFQHYSKQLVSTRMECKLELENKHFSSNLKECTLIKPSNSCISGGPMIYADNIDKLHLEIEQSTFSWSWFANTDKGDDSIIFSNMNDFRLELLLDEDSLEQAENISGSCNISGFINTMPLVCAPKVEEVTFIADRQIVKFSPFKLSITNAQQVFLHGPVNMLPLLSNVDNAKKTYDLSTTIYCARKRDEDYFYMLTNNWFGSNHCSGGSSLEISNLDFELNADKTNWRYVSTIAFSNQLKMSTIVKMLPSMSSLSMLVIKKLIIDQSIQDTLQSLDITTISPLSQSIDSLVLEFNSTKVDNDLAIKSLTYFLLACPSLKMVRTKGFSYDENHLIKKYSKEYPHLEDVEFMRIPDMPFFF